MVPFPDFAPDIAAWNASVAGGHVNVVPKANSWGPFNSLQAYTDALPSECRGAISIRGTDGTLYVIAGTTTKLYSLSGTDWDDRTRAVGGDYNVPAGKTWGFTVYGKYVVATEPNNPPQVLDYTTGAATKFAALGGSPPNAEHCWRCNEFVFVGNTSSSPLEWRHSKLGDITDWTTGLASRQTAPDGGRLMGGIGNEQVAYVFYEEKVRLLRYVPGARPAFTMEDILSDKGCVASRSITMLADTVYWLAEDGFWSIGPNGLAGIGHEKVNRSIINSIDVDALARVQGAADPKSQTVYWRYQTVASDSYEADRIIGYNVPLGRWTALLHADTTWLLIAASSGISLDELDALYPDGLDSIPFSLDSDFLRGGRITLAGFNASDRMGFFNGAAPEAVLETPLVQMGGEGYRSYVNGFRPLIDANGIQGQVITQETPGAATSESAIGTQNVTGLIPVRASARFARLRCIIPEGVTWSDAQGIEEIQTTPMGKR